jgi:hypothetical protein
MTREAKTGWMVRMASTGRMELRMSITVERVAKEVVAAVVVE